MSITVNKTLKKALCVFIVGLNICTASGCRRSELPGFTKLAEDVAEKRAAITWLDLKDGEATLIRAGSIACLIDTGTQEDYSTLISKLSEKGVSKLNLLIITNTLESSCGGAASLVRAGLVEKVLTPRFPAELTDKHESFIQFKAACVEQSKEVVYAVYGARGTIENRIAFTCMGPQGESYSKDNEYSMPIKLELGQIVYLHNSQIGTTAEQELISGNNNVKADILRAVSYSYKDSNTQELIEAVQPKDIIVPGRKKSITTVLNRIGATGAGVWNLRDYGDITLYTDGMTYGFESVYTTENGIGRGAESDVSSNQEYVSGSDEGEEDITLEELE